MHVEQIMSRPAVTCGVNETLNEAARLMWEHDTGVMPVVDDGGRIVGMITDRDICMAAYTQGGALGAIPVANVMSMIVVSCGPQDTVETAEQAMRERQVRRVAVVDPEGRPLGLLSVNDVVRAAIRARKKDGVDRGLLQTLAAICEPRRQPPQAPRAARPKAAAPRARPSVAAAS